MSMNHFLKSLLLALLVTASASAANLFWTGAVSTNYTDAGNWSTSAGVPQSPGQLPGSADAAVIWWPSTYTVPNLCHLAGTAACNPIIVGNNWNGLTDINPTDFYIEDGAALTLGSSGDNWHIMGTVHQSGGTVTLNGNMYLAGVKNYTGTLSGTYEMTGGTFTCGTNRVMTVFNREANAYAYINVYGGNFNFQGTARDCDLTGYPTTHDHFQMTVKDSGSLTFPFNKATTIAAVTKQDGIGPMLRTGDPKQGLVLSWNAATANEFVNYIANQKGWPNYSQRFTATAKYGVSTPLYPLAGQAVPPGSTILQWKNSAPYYDSTTMTRYVRLKVLGPADVNETTGIYADPNGDSYPIIAGPLTADEPNIVFTTVYGENYRWRVDSVDPGNGSDANYPKTIPSPAQVIVCKNQAAVVTIPTTATTPIGLRSGTAAWTTTATAKDDGLPLGGPALTFAWTQVGGPAVTINNAATATPSVTFTAANTYTFRCSVDDSDLIGTADVAVTVYANVCEATKARTGYTAYVGDLNADCWVSFADLAQMASNWSVCNSLDPADPACTGL